MKSNLLNVSKKRMLSVNSVEYIIIYIITWYILIKRNRLYNENLNILIFVSKYVYHIFYIK